jgi:hypothetical protein
LKAAAPAFAIMRHLAMRFRGIFRGSDPSKLDAWLDERTIPGCTAFDVSCASFATTSKPCAMPSPGHGAMGKTEGQINRLKTLKRSMLWPRGNRIAPSPHVATDILNSTEMGLPQSVWMIARTQRHGPEANRAEGLQGRPAGR